jgi:TPP-dependent pyruvate/acetoin dehydrogenase alpha subunit
MPIRSPASPRPTLLDHYRAMARARAFELLLLELWEAGAISGELHLGTGEEAIAAGLAPHLREGDALALDHRATPLLLLRGVDPVAMVREMLGREDGLCGGAGGHMHLFDRDRLAASSGIVGSAAPLACGFALAATRLRPGALAVATFGDGAMNQGMVLESLNLAAAWRLPVLFVCKDNDWAITTESHAVTAGSLPARAEALGVAAREVDGGDPEAVYDAAGALVAGARSAGRPAFLLARTPRLDGHMAGFVLDRVAGSPVREGGELIRRVATSTVARGARVREKAASVGAIGRRLLRARRDRRGAGADPVRRVRERLPKGDAAATDAGVAAWAAGIRTRAFAPPTPDRPAARAEVAP